MNQPIILFDLGGVLVDLGDPVAAIGLDMSDEDFWDMWLSSPLVYKLETGQLSAEDFVSRFAAELGFEDADSFDRAIRSWQLPMFDGAEQYLQSLTGSATVALLSNTNDMHWQHVQSQTDVFATFSKLFLSYETGFAKPHAAAFHDVIRYFACEPADIFFLDDNPNNIAAAKAAGLRAQQTKGLAEARQAVSELLG
jgi:putative hydrolase of the HAD superfamily